MSRLSSLSVIYVCLAACTSAQLPETRWGEPADADDILGVSLTVLPDGTGLPIGSGDPQSGQALYVTHCQSCHGEKGSGGIGVALVGGKGTLASTAPLKTIGSYWPYATTLYDYTRRAMPYGAPMSLSADDYYALTAYLLYINNIVSEDEIMDRETLPLVRMPNRDGFVNMWSFED